MKFPAGEKYNGKFANLFYYNNGTYEFIGSGKVSDGYAEFVFEHASDYVCVITEEAMSSVPDAKQEEAQVTKPEEQKSETQKTDVPTDKNAETIGTGITVGAEAATDGNVLPIVLVILIAAAVIGGVAAFVVMRKKEE